MKSGLAAGLTVLEEFAAEPERAGNLLFVAVPDEEANSAGARSIAQALPDIAQRLGLSLEAAINLDALVDDGDGSAGRAIALGTVGKLLPSAFVVGEAVHASNAARGLNAGALAGALAAEVEWSELLTDRTSDEFGAPPTLLGMKDSRVAYNVTTPGHVWAYWNVMTHRRSPAEVIAAFAALCHKAADSLAAALQGRAEAAGFADRVGPRRVDVLTFDALRREALAARPDAADEFAEQARALAGRGLDLPEQCRLLTELLWRANGRTGPAVVIGFASLPYLPTQLTGEAGERLEAAARAAAAASAEPVGIIRHFPGISDMSFLGQADPAAIPAIAANTPAWGFGILWPEQGGIGGVPIVNGGPWGRDYHTPLERLHTGYGFDVLPGLLMRIVRGVLAA
jgi:arginine utilization protein RocB